MKVKVRTGDSLEYYGQLFMLPLQLLRDANHLTNHSILEKGQTIRIPGFELETRTIGTNDAFWKLALHYNLSIDALLLVNQKRNPNSFEHGEIVYIPKRIIKPLIQGQTFYDSVQLETDIKKLVQVYPFVSTSTIGKSVRGNPIHELRFGKGNIKIHFNASFHANEWITTPILLQLVNTFLLALTNQKVIRGIDIQSLYNRVDVSIVPMVNPDGVDLVLHGPLENEAEDVVKYNDGSDNFVGWKANIRGVDLNNQFPAKWEIEKERKIPKSPSSRDFPGNSPLTEPEAIAMAQLAKEREFHRLLAFHTQGEEFYWGYEGLEPRESYAMAKEFERVSGYRSVQYIDSHAGYKDWFIQEFKQAGFTIELGKGINPLPLSQYKKIYHEMLGIFLAAMYV
jgi:g-D-glutamyl-meso-diaminopimelate peptidase